MQRIVTDRLEAIDASSLPASVHRAIRADILAACATMVGKRITPDYVGRMVARGLCASAEGFEGVSPSTSNRSSTRQGAQIDVAGAGIEPSMPHPPHQQTTPSTMEGA